MMFVRVWEKLKTPWEQFENQEFQQQCISGKACKTPRFRDKDPAARNTLKFDSRHDASTFCSGEVSPSPYPNPPAGSVAGSQLPKLAFPQVKSFKSQNPRAEGADVNHLAAGKSLQSDQSRGRWLTVSWPAFCSQLCLKLSGFHLVGKCWKGGDKMDKKHWRDQNVRWKHQWYQWLYVLSFSKISAPSLHVWLALLCAQGPGSFTAEETGWHMSWGTGGTNRLEPPARWLPIPAASHNEMNTQMSSVLSVRQVQYTTWNRIPLVPHSWLTSNVQRVLTWNNKCWHYWLSRLLQRRNSNSLNHPDPLALVNSAPLVYQSHYQYVAVPQTYTWPLLLFHSSSDKMAKALPSV